MKFINYENVALLFLTLPVTKITSFVVPTSTTQYNSQHSIFTQLAASSSSVEEETEVISPRKLGLALQLDDGTRKSHSLAENTAFVSGFFKGLSTRVAYRSLLTSLYFVYLEMESSFDTTVDESVKALDYPELRRLGAIKKDMSYFYGSDWESSKNSIKPSFATQTYVSRIKEVSVTSPHLLIAHQYSRYLGDLFGGQMMSGMASRSLKLEESKGVQFYEFDDLDLSVNKFIDLWYTKLNALDLTDKQKQEIVDEANYVFALNIGIFEELDGNSLKAMWTIAISLLKSKLGLVA